MIPSVTVAEAAALFEADKAVLIDVREPDEYAAARIEGATLAPMSQMPAAWRALDLPAGKTVIVQCLSGGRSGRLCEALGPTGPDGQPIVNLAGGIKAWHAAGLPIVTAD